MTKNYPFAREKSTAKKRPGPGRPAGGLATKLDKAVTIKGK
jgi:altronate dehydratase